VPHPDFGYYDLNDWRVLDQQARLAKAHGIHGFCFYHYYFAGRRLLEMPVNQLLQHPEIDLPFCLCWANENWTRAWDGGDNEILMAQDHSPYDDLRFVQDLQRYLEDPRYIRVAGKPMVLVYRPHLLPDMKNTAARWRAYLKEAGVGDIYLVCTYGALGDETPPQAFGCDAAVEFPPNVFMRSHSYFNYWSSFGFLGKVNSYPRFIANLKDHRRKHKTDFDLYRSVMLRWDNTPRRKGRGTIFWGFNARRYREWLDYTLSETRASHPEDRRFVFINAWNEWAEGTYLEPDTRYGYRLLNETSRALTGIAPCRALPKVSVIVPNYNHARFLRQRLESIYQQTYRNIEVLLLDDDSDDESREILDHYAARYPAITRTIYNRTNSGSVFRQWRKALSQARGDLVWIAESDDYCDADFLDKLVSAFDDDAVTLAYAHYVFVDEQGVAQPNGFENYVGVIDKQKWTKSYVNTAHREVREALGMRNCIPNASGAVFRRRDGLTILDDPEWLDMRICGDWVFYLHLIRGGKIAYRVDTNSYFRFHTSNTSVATYATDAYYREHGIVAYHTALLYDIPEATLRRSHEIIRDFYRQFVPGGNDAALDGLFDLDRALAAQTARTPNILISALAFSTGGAEVTPVLIANELKRLGHAVTFHSRDFFPETEMIRKKLRADVPVVKAPDARVLKTVLADFGIEVVNTHHHAVQRFGLEMPEVFDEVRHIGTLHGVFENIENDSPETVDRELPLIDRDVDCWTYVAAKNLSPFRSRGISCDERFVHIPNGIDSIPINPVQRASLGIPAEAFVLCVVSRGIPEKGWMEGIEMVARAREASGRDVHLVLVGDGPVYDQLRRNGTEAFVHAVGFQAHPMDYLAMADLGFLPSRYRGESMPNSVIEGFFAGKPVIAGDVGEISAMLSLGNQTAGAIIPVRNWEIDVAAGAELIAGFASDPARCRRAAELVPALAERYRIDNVVQRYLAVFTSTETRRTSRVASDPACVSAPVRKTVV
jgi:glycosyltransferase involved in cell wall biosynthesis